MMFKVLAALKKLHDAGICHFDIKEQNIFTMNDYTPVLADLGMLHTVSMAKKIGFSGGTPLYLGKRVMNGASLAITNCKADIFALGVVFYQLINGSTSNYINGNTIKSLAKYTTNYLLK